VDVAVIGDTARRTDSTADRRARVKVSYLSTAATVDVPAGTPVRFGRGEDKPVDLLVPGRSVSRHAGTITDLGGRTQIQSFQRPKAGWVDVLLPGGHVAAHLGQGGEHVLADPVFVVKVCTDNEAHLLQVTCAHHSEPHIPTEQSGGLVTGPNVRTHTPWTAQQILAPPPGEQWRTVVAIAAARAVRAAGGDGIRAWQARVPTFALVKDACALFYREPKSTRWVSDRLDEALAGLNVPDTGGDKLPRLVQAVLGVGLIDRPLLDELGDRLWGARPQGR
jgi:hypothetical protein